ncbi:MAG: hypothetical protein RIR73_2716 [Chloroflexota bacterium]
MHPIKNSSQQDFSIEALRTGDRAEFARLVDTYSTVIYRLGLKMLGNPQDAEDILQNTFLNALTHLASFEGRSSISTWLYRIAANEALMMIRRGKSNINLEEIQTEDSDDISLPETFVDWSLLPEKELLSGEGKTVLEKAIKQLPENLRMVFILRDVEDLSIKETAEILNLTEVNVKARLLRARMALREQLSSYYAERAARKETQ